MSSYNIRVNRASQKRITAIRPADINVNVNTTEFTDLLTGLEDVDVSDREDGFLLMWNNARGTHEYVSPYEVVDRSDSNRADYTGEPQDPSVAPGDDAIDYGTF